MKTTDQLHSGCRVWLASADNPASWTAAVCAAVAETGDVCNINVPKPPPWFRVLLQRHGLLISARSTYRCILFNTHKGTWMDSQDMNEYTLEVRRDKKEATA